MRLSRLGRAIGGWPRRLAALGCLILAGISATRGAAPTGRASTADNPVPVVVAARDLASGSVIGPGDVRLTQWPQAVRPAQVVSELANAIGHRVAGPLQAGEAVTPARLADGELTAGLAAGTIAVAVPLVDLGSVALIRAGDRVDLLSPPASTGQLATVVAAEVLVLAVVESDVSTSTPAGAGAELIVAVDHAGELRIATAISTPLLATVIKPP